MPLCYESVLAAIQAVLPASVPTQVVNLTLLVSAFLLKRSCTLSELARAYPAAPSQRTPPPKHDLHYRLRRLDRFLSNPRFDPLVVQYAFIPQIVARLGYPHQVGLAPSWRGVTSAFNRLNSASSARTRVSTVCPSASWRITSLRYSPCLRGPPASWISSSAASSSNLVA